MFLSLNILDTVKIIPVLQTYVFISSDDFFAQYFIFEEENIHSHCWAKANVPLFFLFQEFLLCLRGFFSFRDIQPIYQPYLKSSQYHLLRAMDIQSAVESLKMCMDS